MGEARDNKGMAGADPAFIVKGSLENKLLSTKGGPF